MLHLSSGIWELVENLQDIVDFNQWRVPFKSSYFYLFTDSVEVNNWIDMENLTLLYAA